jgi:hypothetical protein
LGHLLTLVKNVKEPLNTLIITGKSVLDWCREFSEENPVLTNTLIIAGAAVAGVTIAAGALLVPVAAMGLLAGKAAIGVGFLGKSMAGLNLSMRANPIGVMLTVAQYALPFILANLDWVWEKLQSVWNWAKDIFSSEEEKEINFDVNKNVMTRERKSIESVFSVQNIMNPERVGAGGMAFAGAGGPDIKFPNMFNMQAKQPVKQINHFDKEVKVIIPEGANTSEIIREIEKGLKQDSDMFESASVEKSEDMFSMMLDMPE